MAASILDRIRIEPEKIDLLVCKDGTVRQANEHETEQGDLISAEKDMQPVAMDSPLRTWGFFSMAGYWIAEGFGISQYQVASSSVSAGLSPGAAIGAVLLGHVIISVS